jgi:F0F1-type ATP synthase assembly protein I
MMRKSTKRKLVSLWGYLLLAAVLWLWFVPSIGPGLIVILSAFVVVYCLFQAPMWCCAETRSRELCRNNAYGLLMGCHLRQHKWQKVKLAVQQQAWSQAGQRVFRSVGGQAATFSALAGMVSASVATVAFIVK